MLQIRLAIKLGPDLPQLVRDMYRDRRMLDCDVLRDAAAPCSGEQADGRGGRGERGDGERVSLLAVIKDHSDIMAYRHVFFGANMSQAWQISLVKNVAVLESESDRYKAR